MKSRLFGIVLFSSVLACALAAPGYVVTSSAQETSKPLVAWAKQHAIPITTVEPGHGFADLQALKRSIGRARIVALGESAHEIGENSVNIHQFRAFRNRLLEFLVGEMGFTAIATETGFSGGLEVDDYVMGRTVGSANLAQRVYMYSPQADGENLELIEWMRRYNARPSTVRKIRFFGIDLGGGDEERRALDAALSYVERVDTAAGKEFRERLEPFLAKFNNDGYSTLAPAERNTLTATIADLVNLFDRRRIDFLAVTSESDYQIAYRHAVIARQRDVHFRLEARDNELKDFREDEMARDATMADNVRWALEREGPEGRILVFAHDVHVMKGTTLKTHVPEYFPGKPPTRMGQYLRSMFGKEMVVLGFTFQRGEDALQLGTADPTSVDGVLAEVGLPLFALDLRSAPKAGPVADWLHQGKRMRVHARYDELVPIDAFDVLLFVESVSAAHPIHLSDFSNIRRQSLSTPVREAIPVFD